jgi:hypothetical protein
VISTPKPPNSPSDFSGEDEEGDLVISPYRKSPTPTHLTLAPEGDSDSSNHPVTEDIVWPAE